MDTKKCKGENRKLDHKLSIIKNISWYRNRSMSCAIPEFEEVAYELHFVPMLKPKKAERHPSPFRLNEKGIKNMKKNRKSQFLMDQNNYFLSCPDQDDVDSDSTEETFDLQNKKTTKKFLEEEKSIQDFKSYSKEYEMILKKENSSSFKEFDLLFDENEDSSSNKFPKNNFVISPKRKSTVKTQLSSDSFNKTKSPNHDQFYFRASAASINEDDYALLKATSENFSELDFTKNRTNSILRQLQKNVHEKESFVTYND